MRKYNLDTSIFKYVIIAFDGRTKSARELWRQMQASRYHAANPKLKINTHVLSTADPPEVVFKFIDDTEVSTKKKRNKKRRHQNHQSTKKVFLTFTHSLTHSLSSSSFFFFYYYYYHRNDTIVNITRSMKYFSMSIYS